MQPHASLVCQSILQSILADISNQDDDIQWSHQEDPNEAAAAEAFAIYSALKYPEQWSYDFHVLLSESLSILSTFGIITHRNNENNKQVAATDSNAENAFKYDITLSTELRKALRSAQRRTGKSKAAYLTRVFCAINNLLQKVTKE